MKNVKYAKIILSAGARKVESVLRKCGFFVYLVGGCVRDSLAGVENRDFDFVTNASFADIKKAFPRTIIIGNRFKLAHVRINGEIVEVSSLASSAHSKTHNCIDFTKQIENLLLKDSLRRDYTINALYYDHTKFQVIDYQNGLIDIDNKIVRSIGNSKERYVEDPARILRAIKLAAKLNFSIEDDASDNISACKDLLIGISPARLAYEIDRLFTTGAALKVSELLIKYNLFEIIFPETYDFIINRKTFFPIYEFIKLYCINTDARVQYKIKTSSAFLFAVFLWPKLLDSLNFSDFNFEFSDNLSDLNTLLNVANSVIQKQAKILLIPNYGKQMISYVWALQFYMTHSKNINIFNIKLIKRYFRAAYDFLLLRAYLDSNLNQYCLFWKDFYEQMG